MIWIPSSYIYGGELTLSLAARVLFNLYTMSVTYFVLINKGMNVSLHCIILTLSDTQTHTHTHKHTHTEPEDRGSMFLNNVGISFQDHIVLCFIMQNTTTRIAVVECHFIIRIVTVKLHVLLTLALTDNE